MPELTRRRSPDAPDEGGVFGQRMAIPMNTEETLEECKRHIDECAALLEKTSVPEYREAIIAMGKAWMKIAETMLNRRASG